MGRWKRCGRLSWLHIGVNDEGYRRIDGCAVIVAASMEVGAFSADDLRTTCADKTKGAASTACLAYIRGLMEGLALGNIMGKATPRLYCPPLKGVSAEQARFIAEKFMREHPEKLHEEAAFVITESLVGAFHCPSN
jgi:hypothetical protein